MFEEVPVKLNFIRQRSNKKGKEELIIVNIIFLTR